MERWWGRASALETKEVMPLVVSFALHDLPRWKRDVLYRLSLLTTKATQELLSLINEGLSVVFETEDESKIAVADLAFRVGAERAEMVRALIAKAKFDTKRQLPLAPPLNNSYRFFSCEEAGDGTFRVVSRIAEGKWVKAKKGGYRHKLSAIDATLGFQQLLASYVGSPTLSLLPRALRAGVCQNVAQEILSYLGQLESSRVRGETAFPEIRECDPEVRQRAYEAAIDVLVRDLRPLTMVPARELQPGKYRADDPRGDRLRVNDERWSEAMKSPESNLLPLFFVTGDTVKLLLGTVEFDAGISKRNRHRGNFKSDDRVRAARSEKIRRHGFSGLQAWYAAIPVLDCEDGEIVRILGARESKPGRGLDLKLRPAPIQARRLKHSRRAPTEMLVPLSGNRDRAERVLNNPNLEIAWSKLVRGKHGGWFLQITPRVPVPFLTTTHRVLGVSFGLNAIATILVVSEDGEKLYAGSLEPNEQILKFMSEKRRLEWNQVKGRWVGGAGASFNKTLELIAHGVANQLLELARAHEAVLAVEDVSYVMKAGRDAETNLRFTAWNYGQLRRILEYKSRLAGLGTPVFVSDYLVAFTCPSCGTIRRAKEKPGEALTWLEDGVLNCRQCGFKGALAPEDRAKRVALHGLSLWKDRWAKK